MICDSVQEFKNMSLNYFLSSDDVFMHMMDMSKFSSDIKRNKINFFLFLTVASSPRRIFICTERSPFPSFYFIISSSLPMMSRVYDISRLSFSLYSSCCRFLHLLSLWLAYQGNLPTRWCQSLLVFAGILLAIFYVVLSFFWQCRSREPIYTTWLKIFYCHPWKFLNRLN